VPLEENQADNRRGVAVHRRTVLSRADLPADGIAVFAKTISLIARQRVTDTTSGFRAMNRHGIALFAADYPHDYPEVEATVMVVRHQLRLLEYPSRCAIAPPGALDHGPQSVYYMAKVLLAIFVSLFRRNVVPLKEDH